MTDTTAQTRLAHTGEDGVEIGETLPERTHYAHTRYAASNTPGVIWFDPRDGREKFAIGTTGEDLEAVGDEAITGVAIKPFRPESFGDPAAKYVVKIQLVRRERENADREAYETFVRINTYGRSEVCESLAAAREYCRENVPGYADAPRKDAVRERTDIGSSEGE